MCHVMTREAEDRQKAGKRTSTLLSNHARCGAGVNERTRTCSNAQYVENLGLSVITSDLAGTLGMLPNGMAQRHPWQTLPASRWRVTTIGWAGATDHSHNLSPAVVTLQRDAGKVWPRGR